MLFELTLRQTYRNTSDKVLEVVYTFPLPTRAVLLGFASELNGERKVGAVVGKPAAERRYEEALAQGDAPVMLEALGDGLHTANIGNLKPGDELSLEVRFAQTLAFEQGRLRLAIPTTIAPRYGNAASAGLQPQQEPHASLLAAYPLALSVTVAGALAGGRVECPTHRFSQTATDGKLRLDLAPGAWLDRDVVIVLTPREPLPSLVIQARDSVAQAAPVVVMAGLQLPAAMPRQRIALKLLVDCSGSMGGDSIASARAALHGALAGLTLHDHVSVSCFGDTVKHLCAPSACTPLTLQRLKPAIDAIDANLGGTEMQGALKAVFALPVPTDGAGADVLLVTDGEIWQAQEMIAAARSSGHRVFAIGVGTSPAEGVLRSLAEATGGACEFATPGEALEAAAGRMLARIRQQPWIDARIDWGCETLWQTQLPHNVFGGDTVIGFAGLAAPAAARTVRLLAGDAQGVLTELARGEADAPCPGDTLPRIAAARRIATAGAADAAALAVAYQLMSQHTHCILVHPRAEAEKATGEAELHRISSMLAAGWGASSTVRDSQAWGEAHACSYMVETLFAPSTLRSARGAYLCGAPPAAEPLEDAFIAAPPPAKADPGQFASLAALAQAVVEHLSNGCSVQALGDQLAALDLHAAAHHALEQAMALGLGSGQAWLVLAGWVNQRPDGLADPALAAALRPRLAGLDAALLARCMQLFDRMLGAYASDRWTPSRGQRLRNALIRSEG